MGVRVHKTSLAEADIAGAIEYLSEHDPIAALRFVNELESLAQRLARFPELYPRQRRSQSPEWKDVRMAVIRRFGYLVFYTYTDGLVVIRRLVHAARNIP